MGNYEMKSLFSDEELEEIRPKPKRPKLGGRRTKIRRTRGLDDEEKTAFVT